MTVGALVKLDTLSRGFIVAKGLLQRLFSWQSQQVCGQYSGARILEMCCASWLVGLTHNVFEAFWLVDF